MNKKKIIIYGNCHTEQICKILKKIPEFEKEYELIEIEPIYKIKSVDYFSTIPLKQCDVFIHQSIRENNRYGVGFSSKNIIKMLNKDCKIIAIPNLYHLPMCFFIQYYEAKEFKKGGVTYFFRDSVIDNLYEKGYSINKISEIYTKSIQNADVNKEFEVFIEKLSEREVDWDVKILDFIKKNYRNKQLFFDPNHPTNYVLNYISKRCLEILNISYDESFVDNIKVDEMCYYEMPVLDIVSNKLDLKYSNHEIRKGGNKLYDKKMDVNEYIKQYAAFEWQNDKLALRYKIKSYLLYLIINFFQKINWIKNIFVKIRKKVWKIKKYQ